MVSVEKLQMMLQKSGGQTGCSGGLQVKTTVEPVSNNIIYNVIRLVDKNLTLIQSRFP